MESTLVTHDLLSCAKCTRLRDYISRVKPRRKFAGQKYWSRPVPGFGDSKAKLVVVGLAPAAHGGNRTGRPFTGDESGKWVVKGLHELGLANREESVSRDDGLELRGVYLTNAVKCAPPKNRPTREEVENCSHWLSKELNELREAKVILALGRVAFEAVCSLYGVREEFGHGKKVKLPDGKILVGSYHVSPQNTRTGRLSWEGWVSILQEAAKLAGLV